MDAEKLLTSVKNLNDYIRITQDVAPNPNDIKLQFNMSTILALRKVRSFEIEYLNKYEENGAAIKIFKLLLRFPPSKTWDLLGRELISLLRYWLDAMRKHLILHNNQWWSFLIILLKFIKEIRLKANQINNILLEETAECLLDLATHSKPDVIQRHEILCLFNLCGADSSREIRFALRQNLDIYFTKLSAILPSCGDVAMQYSILEVLLRWLLPRQDKTVRLEAANKWFPDNQFTKREVDIFLERKWLDFFQDARDFLNAHNGDGDLVTSVVCKKLSVGGNVVIGDGTKRTHWLDINRTTGRLSVTLEPKDLEILSGELPNYCGTLVITEAMALSVKYCSGGSDVTISVVTSRPPQIVPSLISMMIKDTQVNITVDPESDLRKVNDTLREIFKEKYQVLFDDNNTAVASSSRDISRVRTEEDNTGEERRIPHTTEPIKRRKMGAVMISKSSGPVASSSTASTTSLAQLHDKLAALPSYDFEKVPISVCARPQLSVVNELSEEDRQSLNNSSSTLKSRPYGVCRKSGFIKTKTTQDEPKCLSPAVVDDNSVSCLLVATIGSADASVINDTLERFPKDNADNIVDMLVWEAFKSKGEGSNKGQELLKNSDVKETNKTSHDTKRKTCTVISNSSHTEESNMEFVEGTQFTNNNFDKRRKDKELPRKQNTRKSFDEKAVEEFFSQHFGENRDGGLVISPTLARKINESSSETSEEIEVGELNFETREVVQEENDKIVEQVVPNVEEKQSITHKDGNFHANERVVPDLEVIECVNFILDRVCLDFTVSQKVSPKIDGKKANVTDNSPRTGIESQKESNTSPKAAKMPNKTTPKSIKLKFNSNKNMRITRQRSKLKFTEPAEDLDEMNEIQEYSSPPKQSMPSTEQNSIVEKVKQSEVIQEVNVQKRNKPKLRDGKVKKNTTKEIEDTQDRSTPNKAFIDKQIDTGNTPNARRKRKLYSPKDEKCNEKYDNNEYTAIDDEKSHISEEIIDIDTASENKPCDKLKQITYYKQIERDRRSYRQKLRNQKIKSKEMEMSPRTKRLNEDFENLKRGIQNDEKLIFADKTNVNDIEIYNFTSDSEDEDFKKKISKPKTKVTKVENKEKKKKIQSKQKGTNRSTNRITTKKSDNLVDERMREATVERLNTSADLQKLSDSRHAAEIPILAVDHAMEYIEETNVPEEKKESRKTFKKQKKTNKNLSLKEKPKVPAINDTSDRTESPLPGLVVEANVPIDSKSNESVTAEMIQKFQEIYEGKSVHESERESTQNLLDTSNSSKNKTNITVTKDNTSNDHVEIDDVPLDYMKTSKPSSTNEHSSPMQKRKRKRTKSIELEKGKTERNESLRLSKENDGEKKRETNSSSRVLKERNRTESKQNKTTVKTDASSFTRKRDIDPEVINISEESHEKSFANVGSSGVPKERNRTESKKTKTTVKTDASSFTRKRDMDPEVINISEESHEKSFATVGHSPITAHGVLNQCENDVPPASDSWRRSVVPRNLEVEYFDRSVKEFFNILNKEIVEGTFDVRNSKSASADSSDDENGSNNPSVALLKTPLVSVTRLSSAEINKWLPSHHNSEDAKTPTVQLDPLEKDKSYRTGRKEIMSKTKGAVKIKASTSKKNGEGRYVSSISPIKLFDEIKPLPRRGSNSSVSTECDESRNNISPNKKTSPVPSTHTKVDNYEVRSSFASDGKINSTRTSQNKRPVENLEAQRVDSTPSISSVNDWFNRMEPTMSQEEAKESGIEERLALIMEKLDTTLVETNYITSRRLATIFAEAQAKLAQEERERKLSFAEILKKFEEVDKRAKENAEQFMEDLKAKTKSVIREDCSNKLAVIHLLKEEVQAIRDLCTKKKRQK